MLGPCSTPRVYKVCLFFFSLNALGHTFWFPFLPQTQLAIKGRQQTFPRERMSKPATLPTSGWNQAGERWPLRSVAALTPPPSRGSSAPVPSLPVPSCAFGQPGKRAGAPCDLRPELSPRSTELRGLGATWLLPISECSGCPELF